MPIIARHKLDRISRAFGHGFKRAGAEPELGFVQTVVRGVNARGIEFSHILSIGKTIQTRSPMSLRGISSMAHSSFPKLDGGAELSREHMAAVASRLSKIFGVNAVHKKNAAPEIPVQGKSRAKVIPLNGASLVPVEKKGSVATQTSHAITDSVSATHALSFEEILSLKRVPEEVKGAVREHLQARGKEKDETKARFHDFDWSHLLREVRS